MKRAKNNSAKRNGVKPKIPSTGAIVRHWIQSDPCKQGDIETAAILLSELYREALGDAAIDPLIQSLHFNTALSGLIIQTLDTPAPSLGVWPSFRIDSS